MNAKELRAAAQHAQRVAGYQCTTVDQVCDYVLATVRDDDDEAVTVEWLSQSGFTYDEAMGAWGNESAYINGDGVKGWIGVAIFDVQSDNPKHRELFIIGNDYDDEVFTGISNPTRGQLRKLCSALGIELKEPQQ